MSVAAPFSVSTQPPLLWWTQTSAPKSYWEGLYNEWVRPLLWPVHGAHSQKHSLGLASDPSAGGQGTMGISHFSCERDRGELEMMSLGLCGSLWVRVNGSKFERERQRVLLCVCVVLVYAQCFIADPNTVFNWVCVSAILVCCLTHRVWLNCGQIFHHTTSLYLQCLTSTQD